MRVCSISSLSSSNYLAKNSVKKNQGLKLNSMPAEDKISFKSKNVKTATGVLTGLAGGILGFCIAGPVGAIIGAGAGGGIGYSMENEDGQGSTGDANFNDKRD